MPDLCSSIDTLIAENKPRGLIKEGLAAIGGGVLDANNVFYNPVQVFNRDLSIVAIRVFATIRNEEQKADFLSKQKKRSLEQAENQINIREEKPYKLNILEPLAATELDDVINTVVAGDVDPTAVRTVESNRNRNGISSDRLQAVCCDANQLMHSCRYGGIDAAWSCQLTGKGERPKELYIPINTLMGNSNNHHNTHDVDHRHFDVIDLDPYGSVAGFLDAAVQTVRDGGMLCLTSTDMPILCGNNPEVSFYKYGGTAVKARYMHEMALRLLINAACMAGARHKRVIVPLACCSIDFYVRCFVRVYSSPLGCKALASKSAIAFQCTNCDAFTVVPLGLVSPKDEKDGRSGLKFKAPQIPQRDMSRCNQCENSTIWIAGPFYAGTLYDKTFVNRCLTLLAPENENSPYLKPLTMIPRLRGLLTAIMEEIDIPLFYLLPSLMNRIKTETMKLTQFKSALLHLGYRVSHFHKEPQSIKTDAPDYVVFDIVRKWALEHPPKNPEKFPMLQKPFTVDAGKINFELHANAVNKSIDVPKWLPNPVPYWGPKGRAKPTKSTPISGSVEEDCDLKKRRINR